MKNLRREEALKRLEAQLVSGKKTAKKTIDVKIELTKDDTKRIKEQIKILKSLIA